MFKKGKDNEKSYVFIATLLIGILLTGCGTGEQNNFDKSNSGQEVKGYIVEINGNEILLLEDATLKEFEKVEDKFISDNPSSKFEGTNPTFDGPDDADLIYIN